MDVEVDPEIGDDVTENGHQVSDFVVRRLLKALGYSLQANAKTTEGAQHPDRDAQFQYLNDQADQHLDAGNPVTWLFSHISMNWRGRPLTSHEVIVNTIAATRTASGLRVHAELDTTTYATGRKIPDDEMKALEADGILTRKRMEF